MPACASAAGRASGASTPGGSEVNCPAAGGADGGETLGGAGAGGTAGRTTPGMPGGSGAVFDEGGTDCKSIASGWMVGSSGCADAPVAGGAIDGTSTSIVTSTSEADKSASTE